MSTSCIRTILIGAIDDSKHPDLVDAIMNADTFIESHDSEPHRTCTINTKYYTARVQFCHQLHPALSARSTDESIEAFLLYLDHPFDSLVKELVIWEKVRPTSAEFVAFVSKHSIPEDQKEAVLVWCANNECELIELDLVGNPTADSFIDRKDKFGIERLVEALCTHQWSNLSLTNYGRRQLRSIDPFIPLNVTPIGTPPKYYSIDDESYPRYKLEDLFQNLKSTKFEISSLSKPKKFRAEEMVRIYEQFPTEL